MISLSFTRKNRLNRTCFDLEINNTVFHKKLVLQLLTRNNFDVICCLLAAKAGLWLVSTLSVNAISSMQNVLTLNITPFIYETTMHGHLYSSI